MANIIVHQSDEENDFLQEAISELIKEEIFELTDNGALRLLKQLS